MIACILNASRYFFLSLFSLDQKVIQSKKKPPKVPISVIHLLNIHLVNTYYKQNTLLCTKGIQKGKGKGRDEMQWEVWDTVSQAQCQTFYICGAIWRHDYYLQQVCNRVKRRWWVLYPQSKVKCEQRYKINTNQISYESREEETILNWEGQGILLIWKMVSISTGGDGIGG